MSFIVVVFDVNRDLQSLYQNIFIADNQFFSRIDKTKNVRKRTLLRSFTDRQDRLKFYSTLRTSNR
jgi:hypothetical protein